MQTIFHTRKDCKPFPCPKECSHSNLAPVIGTVPFTRWDEAWTQTFKEKKRIFGSFHTAVGGPGDAEAAGMVVNEGSISIIESTAADVGDEVEDKLPGAEQLTVRPGRLGNRGQIVREDINLEPVFMHALHHNFHEELLHSFAITAQVDATPGAGDAALACVKARVPYVGICLTQTHEEKLMQRLLWLAFNEMQKEDSPMTDPALRKLLGGLAAAPAAEPPAKKPRSAAKASAVGVVPLPTPAASSASGAAAKATAAPAAAAGADSEASDN